MNCTGRQLEGKKKIRDRFMAMDLCHSMLFYLRANLGDVKEKRDATPPNNTHWIKLEISVDSVT